MGISADQVTVIVPTKNEVGNIERFLGSLPPDVRLVVVDSSTDATPDLIARTRPERTTVIHEDVNIPAARQLGASVSSTPWLLFTDADVAFEPDYFEHLATTDVDRRCGGLVGAKGTMDGFDLYHRIFLAGQVALTTAGIPAATGSNMLVRRSTLIEVGGFDRQLSVNEDTELMFRVHRSGWSVRMRADLKVVSFDHRRLEAGVARKFVHGTIRNTALFLGVFGSAVRGSDWGYWQTHEREPETSS
ncbi:glycosyltransferase [Ilumatobacter nonamiensis]|uniref:glycosyltransferase n=1 Tax=Ilumatobacter nonamiensis TaxID=467093 RepID=UPI00034C0430|nr:glycosyltransferase [Ilumatobacter nonamiensis]